MRHKLGISPLQHLYPFDEYIPDGIDGIYQMMMDSIVYGSIDAGSIVNRDSVLFVEDPPNEDDYLEQNADIPPKNSWSFGTYTNLFGYSLRARDWTMVNNATATANEVASPWGVDRADEAVFTASAADGFSQTVNTSNTTSYNFSVFAKMQTATGSFKFACSADGGSTSAAQTVTTTWTRFNWTVVVTTGETPSTFTILNGDATARDILFWGMQLTVSAYELPLAFGSNLNKVSHPLEFEDASWTKTNLTPDDDAGANGVYIRVGAATTKLTATADNGIASSDTFAVVLGDVVPVSLTLKKTSGSGNVMLTFGDASDYADLAIDLDAGTVTTSAEVDISIIDSEIIELSDDWYRVNMRCHCEAAIAAAFVEVILATSGDIISVDVCYGYIQAYDEHCMFTEPADTTGLVSSYLYDNDEGFNDNTGSNDGTNSGTVLQGDGSSYFDGTSNIIVSDDNSLDITDKITMEAVFKLNTTVGDQSLVCKWWDGSKQSYYITIKNGGAISFGLGSDSGVGHETRPTTSHVVVANKWYRVSVTSNGDGGEVHCYLNGVDATTSWIKSGNINANTADFRIGRYCSAVSGYINGIVREVNIYETYKTASQELNTFSTAMNQATYLEYPETIAAEASSYIVPDQEISLSSLPASGKFLCAVITPSVAPTDMRAADGRVVGIDDGSDDYYIKFDKANNQITGHWDDADISINAASFRVSMAAGRTMFVLVCEDYLFVKDSLGTEWTAGAITSPPVKKLTSTSLGIGSELTTTTGDYADFADCKILYAGSGGSNMSVMSLSYIRDLANWFLDKV